MCGRELNTSHVDTWHGLREPDGRVPAQRADFEDVLGAQELAEEGEVLALGGGDGYGWEGLVLAVGFGGGEAGFGFEELGLGLLGAGDGLGEDGGEGDVGRHCCGLRGSDQEGWFGETLVEFIYMAPGGSDVTTVACDYYC